MLNKLHTHILVASTPLCRWQCSKKNLFSVMDVIWIDGEVSELPWNETRLRHTAETEQRNGVQRGGGVAHILACRRRRLPTSHYLTDSETRDRFPLSLSFLYWPCRSKKVPHQRLDRDKLPHRDYSLHSPSVITFKTR